MRLFVAAWPPAAVVEQLAELERPARPGVRWTTSEQWHVTLQFLGDVGDAGEVAAVETAFHLVRAPATTAVAGPTVRRLGTSVLCLPVAGLDQLATDVIERTAGLGPGPRSDRRFDGHLTLARGRRGVDLRPLAAVPLTATWPVAEITLVASRLHPRGARYEVLGRCPLATPTDAEPR